MQSATVGLLVLLGPIRSMDDVAAANEAGTLVPSMAHEMAVPRSIRGEFLRQLRRHEQDADEPLGLEACLSGATVEDHLGELVLNVPASSRTALVHEAAMLGVDLLAGEEYES